MLSRECRFSKISAGYSKIPAINLAEKEKLITCKMHRWDFIFSFVAFMTKRRFYFCNSFGRVVFMLCLTSNEYFDIFGIVMYFIDFINRLQTLIGEHTFANG